MSRGETLTHSTGTADIVVDASIALKWFLVEDYSSDALRLLDTRFRLHAPSLLHAEFGQTIWKRVRLRNEISELDGSEILRALAAVPMTFHPIASLTEDAFRIAVMTGRTVYDSIYIALAVALNCRLVTADRKLYQSLRGSRFNDDLVWVADIGQLS
jgi:predicted nucleic acid-binding protein